MDLARAKRKACISILMRKAIKLKKKKEIRSLWSQFPTPYVFDHVTFVGEGGMGNLVWIRIFFNQISLFFPDI